MSAQIGLIIPCVLLLLTPGGIFANLVQNGTLGGSVYFYESVPVSADLIILWTFSNAVFAQRFPGGDPVCVGLYTGRCALSENGTLRLDSLTFTDEGEYSMVAQYPNSTVIKESKYTLRVYNILTAPVISSNGTSDRFISGTYVSLYCNASNQIVTTYTFYRNEKLICPEPHVTCRDSHLYFQPITESDSGRYTCTIQNPVSSNSSSNFLQLNVSDPVSDVKLSSNISGLVWPGLDSVSLNCSARGTDVTYSWSLQGAALPQNPNYHFTENNRVLTISPVSPMDNGTFICTAKNWINEGISSGVTLILGSAISTVTLTGNMSGSYIWAGEESVSLICLADGSAVTFLWKLTGLELPQSPRYHLSETTSPPQSNLFISPVSKDDAGNFSCEASNQLGSKTSDGLSLNLAWSPERNINCTAVPSGSNVELGCNWSGGQPSANVSLLFGGQTNVGVNSVLRNISTSDNFQGTNLTCVGDQMGRLSQCTVIFVPPEAPGHDNNRITEAKSGETVVLLLTLLPGLPAEFMWYRLNPDPVPITANRKISVESTSSISILRIPDVTQKDAGKYECRAKNIIGTQSFLFTVNVAKSGLGGGEIAGIVIGVLAGIALIGILVFFIVKKKKCSGSNKRISEPEDQLGTPEYATVNKQNKGIAETSLTNNQQDDKDDVKYAALRFPNNTHSNAPAPVETEYSTVKLSTKQ